MNTFIDMIHNTIWLYFIIILFCCCTQKSTEQLQSSISKHAYTATNDSIDQSIVLLLLDSLHTQFILKVEHKYLDTIDSYMGSATSTDQIHYFHNRKNCSIDFTRAGIHLDTIFLTRCECPELTVKPSFLPMRIDTLETRAYR